MQKKLFFGKIKTKPKPSLKLEEKMKDIAIVTGASSGIGREFVRQIDNSGYDEIWGIALGKEMLEQVKNETNTPMKVFDFDLTQDETFAKFVALLKKEKPNVKLLINCSGFGKFGRYDEIPVEQSANMVDLNCKGYVRMTEYTLPYIHSGGRIIQIASVAGFQPVPYLSVYGATKAFVVSYSRALNEELRSSGISITCVCPFWTKTNFFSRAKDTKSTCEVVTKYTAMYDSVDVVKRALRDAKKRKQISIYGFKARMQCRLSKLLPHKSIMRFWIRQQKLNQKYKNK